ncbi:50S ribosomal protein L25 [Sediminispirochaeta bajacaliforniensis]|uniref:50S ribosomal protein L25 n=1 Tax=Sediminispirochaeta bajacaliforniensis TaxID=148 RepID=UPI00035D9BCB|nr:50S ribosomal protein L25 [Sediminispirochaeta bajacaliforniensis]
MEQKTLTGFARTELKKGAAKRLRREGKIPAIIYGHSEPVPISVPANEFEKKYSDLSESTIITISVGGKEYDVLIKDYQENTMRGEVTHLDFFEIERGKKLKTHVPLHAVGTAQGIKEGGILELGFHEIEIECLPKDIPSHLEINVEGMAIGDSRHISDISVPEGVTVLVSTDMVAASITTAKVEETAPEEGEEEAAAADAAAAEASAAE